MTSNNIPQVKLGIVAVSRDCFPIALSTQRRENIVKAYKGEVFNCQTTVENEQDMLKAIEEALDQGRHHIEVTIPYSQGGMLDTLHSTAQVLSVDYTGDGIVVETIVDPILYGRLKDFITKEIK